MSVCGAIGRVVCVCDCPCQKALNETRILLLGAGATGTETLKNLVLPGIGHITVVDDRSVTDDECKDNFFVTRAHVGQPLAKVRRSQSTAALPYRCAGVVHHVCSWWALHGGHSRRRKSC